MGKIDTDVPTEEGGGMTEAPDTEAPDTEAVPIAPNAFEPVDFSLVQGGPVYQLFLRARLLRPPMEFLGRRIAVILAIIWLPLLLLTILSGSALGGTGTPFLYDLGSHVRLLLCVPMFLCAEVIVHWQLKIAIGQFLNQDLIAAVDRPRFVCLVNSAMRLRDSVLAEVLLLASSIIVGYLLGQRYVGMQTATWYAVPAGDRFSITLAGYWYFLISLSIFRFLLLQWYFRLLIWYRFLWQVSQQIRLRLNALHPDRAGGLGFLSFTAVAFAPLLLAHSIGLAGILGGKIGNEGAKLPEFKMEIAAWVIFLTALVLAPLFFFVTQLAATKRNGLREYNRLASQYVNDFRRKWIECPSAEPESLVGTADIQSLADLSNSYSVVEQMRIMPFGRETVIKLALVIALPLSPLMLTMFPVEQLIDRALKFVI